MNIILNDIPNGSLIKNIKFEISFENGTVLAPDVKINENFQTVQHVQYTENSDHVEKNVPNIETRASKDVPEEMLNSEF